MINLKLIKVSSDDSFLVQSFKDYCCKYSTIDEIMYDNGTKDKNDYRTVAAIGYLLLSNEKWKHKLSDFKDGLSRISKKDIKSSTLIYDQLALVGITVAIKEYQIRDQYQWLHNILFETELYYVRTSRDIAFVNILKAYFDDQTYPSNVELKDNVLIIWLSTFSKNKIDTYKQQSELLQRAWKCEEYLFNDLLYDGLCSLLIDLLIRDKFEYGIISVEQKYKNAVNCCRAIAQRWAVVLTLLLILIVVIFTVFLLYYAWSYEAFFKNRMEYVPFILQIISIIAIPYGLIKNTKKVYKNLNSRISVFLMKSRRLD